MLVIDSSAWVEWLANTSTARLLEPHWPDTHEAIVPTVVQFEVVKWLRRERGRSVAESFLALTIRECVIVDLDTRIAAAAVEIASNLQLATADALILATARIARVRLLTTDVHFEGLADVIYVPKAPDSV
jgi:predicted nucleic acid-binding protein